MSSTEQNAWVGRVLGVTVSGASQGVSPGVSLGVSPGGAAGFPAALAAWRDAAETVDGQIAQLARALRDTGDDDLADIAEFGLNAVTAGHKVPLMAALMMLGSGDPPAMAKFGAKALKTVQAFRGHIESDERVAACDDNPFGVAVSIRAMLGPALAGLETALRT